METSPNTQQNEYEIFNRINFNHDYQVIPKYNFEGDNPRLPIWLSNSLAMTCYENRVMGLAASQVGIYTRAIYISGIDTALFNPNIIDQSSDEEYMEESTSIYPGLIIKVKRPKVIKVRYFDALGDAHTEIYNGLTARTIQRKIDLLNGISVKHRATKYHRDQAEKRLIKNEK